MAWRPACLLASVAGLAEFAAREPWAYRMLRWGGVLYLLWLALDAWRGKDGQPAAAASRPATGPRLILRGFLINVLNPKAAIFYLSLLPGFIRPERGQVALQGLTLGAVHLTIAVAVHIGIVLLAAAAGPMLLSRVAPRAVRGGFAAGLIAVAAWVAWTTRSA